jgi:hypothetical protein
MFWPGVFAALQPVFPAAGGSIPPPSANCMSGLALTAYDCNETVLASRVVGKTAIRVISTFSHQIMLQRIAMNIIFLRVRACPDRTRPS